MARAAVSDRIDSLVATEGGVYWLSGDYDQTARDLRFLSADSGWPVVLGHAEMTPLVRDGARVCTVVRQPATLECWTKGTRESWPVRDLDPTETLAVTGSAGWSCSRAGLQRFDLKSDPALRLVAEDCELVAAQGNVLALLGAHDHVFTLDAGASAPRARAVASAPHGQGLVVAGERACWHEDERVLCARVALGATDDP